MAFGRRTLNRTAMRDVSNRRVFVSLEKRKGSWVVCVRRREDGTETKGVRAYFRRKFEAVKEANKMAELINTEVVIKQ